MPTERHTRAKPLAIEARVAPWAKVLLRSRLRARGRKGEGAWEGETENELFEPGVRRNFEAKKRMSSSRKFGVPGNGMVGWKKSQSGLVLEPFSLWGRQ